MERFLTIPEVGEMLRAGKKNKLVYELIKKGLIPSAFVGNKRLIKESDLMDYIDKCFVNKRAPR